MEAYKQYLAQRSEYECLDLFNDVVLNDCHLGLLGEQKQSTHGRGCCYPLDSK